MISRINLVLAIVGILAVAVAQPAAPLAFEVASIRQSAAPGSVDQRIEFLPGGRFTAANASLFSLIAISYGISLRRLTGGPDWIRSERYNIEATAEKSAVPIGLSARIREARMGPMLQTLLADRFGVTIRRDNIEQPAYVLEVAKNGPKLQKSKKEEKDCPELDPKNMNEFALSCHYPVGGQGNGIRAKAVDMADVVRTMEIWSDRPFVDRTGLRSLFDFETEGWVPLRPRPGPAPGVEPSAEDIAMADPTRPSLQMIFDRLGLRMNRRT